MRTLAILLLLAEIGVPAFAARRVTVQQLEQVLTAARVRPDADLARQLSDLQLTERLGAGRLQHLLEELTGAESRKALVALTDESAFLEPPASGMPAMAVPSIPAQRQLMAQTIGYVSKTIHQLPNFFATRVTTGYEDTPQRYEKEQTVFIPYRPLHAVSRSSNPVLYRDGEEVADSGAGKGKKSTPPAQGLTTSGEFGPILATVLVDAAHGKLAWSHWEQGAGGPLADFRFSVPREKSHYQVAFCCVSTESGPRTFQQFSGYRGDIAIDPANGTILRLTIQADLKPTDPIMKADILVEYGQVELGGKTYNCPVHSVAISVALPQARASDVLPLSIAHIPQHTQNATGARQTLLNDVAFEQYHLFRADARLLPGQKSDLSPVVP